MKLGSFRALVDNDVTPVENDVGQVDEESILAQIRDCFTAKESDQALADIREVIKDLGLRYMCEKWECEPYLSAAEAVQLALRKRGRAETPASDWPKAVALARKHAAMSMFRQPMDDRWHANVRVSTLSSAIVALRGNGYSIELPVEGGMNVSSSELNRLAHDIHVLAKSLGGSLATSAARAMKPKWSSFTGRFNLGRPGDTLPQGAVPQIPLAYLYQLGLRYVHLSPTAMNPATTLNELVKLLANATALQDLVSSPFDLMFARVRDVLGILQKSTVYDSVFIVAQAKVAHVREYVEWMMRHASFASLRGKIDGTADQIRSLALMLLDVCERTPVDEFRVIHGEAAAFATNLDREPATSLMKEVFCHLEGANKNLTFPPKDTDVDAAFRPIVVANKRFVLQPPPMAARAVLNATIDWCRRAWPSKKFDEEALGPMFEEFVRHKLSQRGVTVLHGKYKQATMEGECDVALETKKEVIFLELKSKMLTREGRSGSDLVALVDLAQALVRPQAQAMTRHAALLKAGALTLQTEFGAKTITLAGREVLKVSITRGDLGSLHDRQFLQQFLRAGSIAVFEAVDSKNQSKLKDLKRWFDRLKEAARLAGEANFNSAFPYSRSWSLSLFQFLLLLEHTTDNDSFSHELQRTRWLITPMRDFYEEYAYAWQHLNRARPDDATPES